MILKNDKFNHWESGVLPYSWYKSGTTKWSGSDSYENWQRNGNLEYEHVDMEYQINEEGFRTHSLTEHTGKKVNIALGCSFTFGVGLPQSWAWPSLVEKVTTLPLLNLGQGGGSSDTVARILTNVATIFDIQTVYILWPPVFRFDLVYDWRIAPILPGHSDIEHVWNLDSVNSIQRFNKNKLIVDLLAEKHQFSTVQRSDTDLADWNVAISDYARDNMHWGRRTHMHLADKFLNSP